MLEVTRNIAYSPRPIRNPHPHTCLPNVHINKYISSRVKLKEIGKKRPYESAQSIMNAEILGDNDLVHILPKKGVGYQNDKYI